MSRLPGWSYAGPDPDGFMTAGEFVTYLPTTPARSPRRSSRHAPSCASAPTATGSRCDHRRDVAGRTRRHRHRLVRPARRPAIAAAARPARSPSSTPAGYREPGRPARRRRARRRGVGHGRAARRRAGARPGAHVDARRRPPQPAAPALPRHGHLLVARRGSGSSTETIDEMRRPGRGPPRAVAAARRPARPRRPRPGHAAGRRRRAGRAPRRRRRPPGPLRPRPPATVAAADERLRRLLARIDAHIDATGLAAEVLDPTRPARRRPAARPTQPRPAGRGHHAPSSGPPGHRRAYPWLHVPVLDAAGEIRQRRGVTPVPGLYVLGQRFQHRRSSNFIDGVGRDARRHRRPPDRHAARAAPIADARRAPPAPERSRPMHPDRTPLRRRRRRRPRRRRGDGDAAGPRRPARPRRRPQPLRRRHALDPRAACAAASSSSTAGGCSTASSRPAPRRPPHDVPLRRRGGGHLDQAVARRRRAVRAAADGARPDARRRGRARPAPRCATASPSSACAPIAGGRVAGIDGRDDAGRPLAVDARRSWSGPTGSRSTVARRVGAPLLRAGHAAPAPSSTATGPASPPTATSGSSVRTPAPASSRPTTALACVFAAATPARIGRGGRAVLEAVLAEAAPRPPDRVARPARAPPGVRTFIGPSRLRAPVLGAGLGPRRRRRLLEGSRSAPTV